MCQAVAESDTERCQIIKLSECVEKEKALGEESKFAKELITRNDEEVTAENLESVAAAEMLASYVNRNSHDTILVHDYPRTTEDVEGL